MPGAKRREDRLPWELQWSLEGSDHRPIAIVLALPRQIRRQAVKTIFTEMGFATLAEHRQAYRDLGDIIFDHRRLRDLMRRRVPVPTARDWCGDVAASASELVQLLTDAQVSADIWPTQIGSSEALVAQLRMLQFKAAGQAAAFIQMRRQGVLPSSKPDCVTARLIRNLAHWYRAETGRKPGLSLYHDHSGTNRSGRAQEPMGPFFRVVREVFRLLGEVRTDRRVGSAIKEHLGKPRKPRKTTKPRSPRT